MSVEGMGNRIQPINTTNNVNNISKVNINNKVEKNQIVEKNPTLNLSNNVEFSKLGKKDFATELKFVSPSNNKSEAVKAFGGVVNSKNFDLDQGSKEIMARKILMKLQSE